MHSLALASLGLGVERPGTSSLTPHSHDAVLPVATTGHYTCMPNSHSWNSLNRAQLWATGYQKTGSTIMTKAIAAGMHWGVNTEAVMQCCCKGSLQWNPEASCNSLAPYSQSDCVNRNNIAGSLFNGSMEVFLDTCGASSCQVVKADDVLWDMQRLRSVLWQRVGVAPLIVFYVRHPIFNIRAMLAWCTEDMASWVDAETAEQRCTAHFGRLRAESPNQDQL